MMTGGTPKTQETSNDCCLNLHYSCEKPSIYHLTTKLSNPIPPYEIWKPPFHGPSSTSTRYGLGLWAFFSSLATSAEVLVRYLWPGGKRGKPGKNPGNPWKIRSCVWDMEDWDMFFSGFLLGYLEYVNGILEHVIYVSTTRNRGRMM